MKVLFISSGNNFNNILPFIQSQEESIKDQGVDVDHFSLTKSGLWGFGGYMKAAKMVRKMHRENRYDLIHAHYSYCGWVAVLALTGLPIVVSFMGTDVYGYVDEKGKRKFSSYSVIIGAKLLQLFVSKIIVKSKNLERAVFMKNKVTIVPNGVDFKKFQPRDPMEARKQLDLPLDRKVILFLGNPKDPRKNFKLLKEALEHLKDLDPLVVTPFPIPAPEIPRYYNVADVFILTSFLEGSPNVVKEAMASGLPVVATDVGDVTDIIKDTPGCYVCSYQAQDLAQKIRKSFQVNLPTSGRQDIGHLELGEVAQQVITVYQKALNGKQKVEKSLA